MKAVDVDFRTRRRPPTWSWMVLAGACAIAIGLGIATRRADDALHQTQARLDEVARELAKPLIPAAPVQQKMQYDESAREMQVLATSNWPAMLTGMESVGIIGATPSAIEIEPTERWIRVDVEFADFQQLLELVDGLNAGEAKPVWGLIQARAAEHVGSSASSFASTATLKGSW